MDYFCFEKRNFFKLPEKIEFFGKFAWKNRFLVGNCLIKSKFFGNLPGKSNFLPGSTTPQISNQTDATVKMCYTQASPKAFAHA